MWNSHASNWNLLPMSACTVGGDTSALLLCRRPPLLEHSLQLSLPVQLLWKVHKDSDNTAMIAVVHWRLHAKTHRAGEVVSAVIICLSFGHHCRFDELSMMLTWHMWHTQHLPYQRVANNLAGVWLPLRISSKANHSSNAVCLYKLMAP